MENDMSANGTKKMKGIAYYHCQNKTGCGKYYEMNQLEEAVAKEFRKLHFSDEFIQLVIEKTRTKLLAGREVYEGECKFQKPRFTTLQSVPCISRRMSNSKTDTQ